MLSSGCYSSHKRVVVTPSGEVVTEAPPPPHEEVVGTAPGESYVWVSGYRRHHDGRWVWVPGHWQTRPRPGATWVAGHWDHTIDGWVWTPGHWD
jgi:hypothetical protein